MTSTPTSRKGARAGQTSMRRHAHLEPVQEIGSRTVGARKQKQSPPTRHHMSKASMRVMAAAQASRMSMMRTLSHLERLENKPSVRLLSRDDTAEPDVEGAMSLAHTPAASSGLQRYVRRRNAKLGVVCLTCVCMCVVVHVYTG